MLWVYLLFGSLITGHWFELLKLGYTLTPINTRVHFIVQLHSFEKCYCFGIEVLTSLLSSEKPCYFTFQKISCLNFVQDALKPVFHVRFGRNSLESFSLMIMRLWKDNHLIKEWAFEDFMLRQLFRINLLERSLTFFSKYCKTIKNFSINFQKEN